MVYGVTASGLFTDLMGGFYSLHCLSQVVGRNVAIGNAALPIAKRFRNEKNSLGGWQREKDSNFDGAARCNDKERGDDRANIEHISWLVLI